MYFLQIHRLFYWTLCHCHPLSFVFVFFFVFMLLLYWLNYTHMIISVDTYECNFVVLLNCCGYFFVFVWWWWWWWWCVRVLNSFHNFKCSFLVFFCSVFVFRIYWFAEFWYMFYFKLSDESLFCSNDSNSIFFFK